MRADRKRRGPVGSLAIVAMTALALGAPIAACGLDAAGGAPTSDGGATNDVSLPPFDSSSLADTTTGDAGPPKSDASDAGATDEDVAPPPDASCSSEACVTDLVLGRGFTFALLADGTVREWGQNDVGQLGDGTVTMRPTPVTLPSLTGVQQLAAGDSHACALVAGGKVACWGSNSNGQLGDGSTNDQDAPKLVPGLNGAKAVACGGAHTCVIFANGAAGCWGLNDHGQLGDNTTTERHYPAPVANASSLGAQQIALGTSHSCVITAGGGVSCWGQNDKGQLGNNSTNDAIVPTAAVPQGTALEISLGNKYTCERTLTGSIDCTGVDGRGELGDGATNDQSVFGASLIVTGASDVAAGEDFACAVQVGSVVCWGFNDFGQLGRGSSNNNAYPVPALTSPGLLASIVGAHGSHACALASIGPHVVCWGDNANGGLGDGTQTTRTSPTPVLWP